MNFLLENLRMKYQLIFNSYCIPFPLLVEYYEAKEELTKEYKIYISHIITYLNYNEKIKYLLWLNYVSNLLYLHVMLPYDIINYQIRKFL